TGVPIKLSDTPGADDRPPPVLGEHTAEILREWLDMGDAEASQYPSVLLYLLPQSSKRRDILCVTQAPSSAYRPRFEAW
ncbi:MAG: hypothetical protein P8Z76_20540, partial [Alphaproteobacteria bacterium]